MQRSRPLPLWAGRTAALVGIILFTLSIRHATATISPIVLQISDDIPLSSAAVGVLGMLPPLGFAAFGLIGPLVVRRMGLERALLVSIALEAVGHAVRGFSPDLTALILSTTVILLGTGIGNVLLPGLVKRYFPDRIGIVTAIYAALIAVSAAMPPAVAVPLADSIGWRFALSIWSAFAAIAAVPWLILLAREHRSRSRATDDSDAVDVIEEPPAAVLGRLWRSRTAVGLTIGFGLCAMNVYAGYAWLPSILVDTTGSTPAEAGFLLAVWSIIGLPVSFLSPMIAARLANPFWLYAAGALFTVAGYLGLLLLPGAGALIWTLLTGLSPVVFSASLALIGLRSRSHEGAVALGGFVQGVGYAIGATGPLLIGLLHDVSSGWTLPLAVMIVIGAAHIVPGVMVARPGYVEDESSVGAGAARG